MVVIRGIFFFFFFAPARTFLLRTNTNRVRLKDAVRGRHERGGRRRSLSLKALFHFFLNRSGVSIDRGARPPFRLGASMASRRPRTVGRKSTLWEQEMSSCRLRCTKARRNEGRAHLVSRQTTNRQRTLALDKGFCGISINSFSGKSRDGGLV